MPVNVRIIDSRVGYSFKTPKPLDFKATPKTDIALLFADIVDALRNQKIGLLQILAHGIYRSDETGRHRFGFGVELGQQNLYASNLRDILGRLAGRFASREMGIELRACAVAQNNAFNEPQGDGGVAWRVGDGLAFCQSMADITVTGVLASTENQTNPCDPVAMLVMDRAVSDAGVLFQKSDEEIRNQNCGMGVWDGNVWLFTPGKAARNVTAQFRGR